MPLQRSTTETYEYLRRISPEFSQQIIQAADQAHNEAEFVQRISSAIASLSRDLDVELFHRQEYTLAEGRADAVYNRLIIEYEPPRSLRANLNHGHTSHAVQQVKQYVEGVAHAEKHALDRLLGVAFDGSYYIFVRYHEGHFIVEQPLEVTPTSTERFLRSLFSLSSGRALVPDNLVEDFGSQNIYSQRATRALYNALAKHNDDLTSRLYAQWQLFFGQVAGCEATAGEIQHKKELRSFARGMGLSPDQIDTPRFFFAIHTYFSFLVKNIARLVLQAYAGGGLGSTPLTAVANLQGEALRRELREMEAGGIFRVLGLKNLLEGDFFSWYLSAWDEQIEDALRLTLGRLSQYNPATVQDDPHSTRDLLKKLYHYLLPREIRHDLGEFYTPDWLAQRVLVQLNDPLFEMPRPGQRIPVPKKRLLDPACGSGTFPVLAIRALKANCFQSGLAEADTLEIILNSVVGIDLNPLAVLAARVNYLLAIADLLPYRRGEIEIPIYLADSILTPARGEGLWEQNRRVLETAVGRLPVPDIVNTRSEMERLTAVLEESVSGSFAPDAFIERCRQELPDLAAHPTSESVLRELYERLCDLHARGLNGIWARILKNAFMPLFLEPFDYVVGNPPWINWESLPQAYRAQIAPLWQQYGIFQHKGFDAILGKAKDDISALMSYVVADRHLRDGGKLAFVITQSVWKTAGAGQGFRRFRIGQEGPYLRVLHVDDLSSLQVFEGATTRTSVFVWQKGRPTRYPVPYSYWKKVRRGHLDYDSTLEEVQAQTQWLEYHAVPVDASDPTSAWLTVDRRVLNAVRKVLGRSDYQARKGVTASSNAVFWLEILAPRPDGLLVVRNLTEGTKREVEPVTIEVEPDLLYPLLRGRDVQRWQATPSAHILMTHLPDQRLRAVPEKEMQRHWPKTWLYLQRFAQTLCTTGVVRRYFPKGPFYSMFNVGDYTFASPKVVFREISSSFTSAVVGQVGGKPVIPDHKLVLCAVDSDMEAHFLCGVLNSTIIRFVVSTFAISTQHSTSILENIRIVRFDQTNPNHRRLAALSQQAHELAPAAYIGDESASALLKQIESEVDRIAATLWELTIEEQARIQEYLSASR